VKEDNYFVISNSDGDTHVEVMTKSELETKLNEDGGGYYNVDETLLGDTNYWREDDLLVIKGEAVSTGKEVRTYLL